MRSRQKVNKMRDETVTYNIVLYGIYKHNWRRCCLVVVTSNQKRKQTSEIKKTQVETKGKKTKGKHPSTPPSGCREGCGMCGWGRPGNYGKCGPLASANSLLKWNERTDVLISNAFGEPFATTIIAELPQEATPLGTATDSDSDSLPLPAGKHMQQQQPSTWISIKGLLRQMQLFDSQPLCLEKPLE